MMKILVYSAKKFEVDHLLEANAERFEITMTDRSLSIDTVDEARGASCISIFAGDDASAPVLGALHQMQVKMIAIRSAGHDNVDISKAESLGITVANVPAYSPNAIAEHAVAMMLGMSRHLVKASQQVKQHDFRVDALIGFNLEGKTVGIIGTGKTGRCVAKILHGFGCNIIAFDLVKDPELENTLGVAYTSLHEICSSSDIITIHTPLNAASRGMICRSVIDTMKPGVMLINTARGAIVNTADVIEGLLQKKIGSFGADVYEHEKGIFFFDRRDDFPDDPMLQQLLDMPNVMVTPHQAFATQEALKNIADTTFENISFFANGDRPEHALTKPNI
ncbi:MAG TPA: 2-hydroxyacid dehydrogenase [Ferruginibacter sp.]|nr:2-hydroxyacid dehydrogenase [Ferruginibacter sp.]